MSTVVVPRVLCLVGAGEDLSLLPDLALAGLDGFQVRDPAATTAELVRLTHIVIAAVRPHGARVFVNDRLDVALAAEADGVHLGADDLPVADAVRLAPHLMVGATCRDRAAVVRAAADGAAYAGFGPVHATVSKTGLPEPRGEDGIRAAAGVLPLLAIGGMDAPRSVRAREAGAHGVAVIGGIWRQPDPLAAAKELVRAVA